MKAPFLAHRVVLNVGLHGMFSYSVAQHVSDLWAFVVLNAGFGAMMYGLVLYERAYGYVTGYRNGVRELVSTVADLKDRR